MNPSLSTLRSLLSQSPCVALWWEVVDSLTAAPLSERQGLVDYVAEHTSSSNGWSEVRLPHGAWTDDSPGWSLSRLAPTRIKGLSRAMEQRCPGGTFVMGAGEEDREAQDNERPERSVTLRDDLWVMTTVVTQQHWTSLMDNNPSRFWQGEEAADRPVECVSWFDAVAFCNALSKAAGLEEAYVLSGERSRPGEDGYRCQVQWSGPSTLGYRLPTEAEWEAFARAGCRAPRFGTLKKSAWYDYDSFFSTHPVGKRAPNAWGLHDTLGNVWEHCFDSWSRFSSEAATDPFADQGEHRVVRGGSWSDAAQSLRVSSRLGVNSHDRLSNVGFRVVRSAGALPR